MLDHLAYPHIFRRTLSYLPHSVLAKLLRTSSWTAQDAAETLFRKSPLPLFGKIGVPIKPVVHATDLESVTNPKVDFARHVRVIDCSDHSSCDCDALAEAFGTKPHLYTNLEIVRYVPRYLIWKGAPYPDESIPNRLLRDFDFERTVHDCRSVRKCPAIRALNPKHLVLSYERASRDCIVSPAG